MKLKRRPEAAGQFRLSFNSTDLDELDRVLWSSFVGVSTKDRCPLMPSYREIQAVWEGRIELMKNPEWSLCLYRYNNKDTNAFYLIREWMESYLSLS